MTKGMRRGWFAAGALAAGLLASAAAAQPARAPATTAGLDALVQSYTPQNRFMGAVLVVQGDRVLLDKGYGQAVVEWNIPNRPDGHFRLGSLTKQFTAALILKLEEDGKLDIEQPVTAYLPDAPKAWSKIKVIDLLAHTSGIPNFTSDPGFAAWRMTPHDWQKELGHLDKPLDFEPGSKFDYSNSNYEILGVLVEKVGGRPYGEQLRARLLDPLGMKETGLDADDLILPRRVTGYSAGPAGLTTGQTESMTVPWAAGSMYSTTGDLLKWERALFGGKVLKPQSLARMTTVRKGDYALGLIVQDRGGAQVIQHGGGIEGFATYLAHAPAKDVTVVVLGNVLGEEPGKLGDRLMRAMVGAPDAPPSAPKAP